MGGRGLPPTPPRNQEPWPHSAWLSVCLGHKEWINPHIGLPLPWKTEYSKIKVLIKILNVIYTVLELNNNLLQRILHSTCH